MTYEQELEYEVHKLRAENAMLKKQLGVQACETRPLPVERAEGRQSYKTGFCSKALCICLLLCPIMLLGERKDGDRVVTRDRDGRIVSISTTSGSVTTHRGYDGRVMCTTSRSGDMETRRGYDGRVASTSKTTNTKENAKNDKAGAKNR